MIRIKDRMKWSGYTVCYNIVRLISMEEGNKGFLSSEADESKCIECGKCK